MVQNLFGSTTVLRDRTFTVGDWIKVAGHEVTIEAIGFFSTPIPNFYNSVVTVPHSQFIIANVDNMDKRRFRRLSTELAIAYVTPPDRIEAGCAVIRQQHCMRKDCYHVYLNGLGDSALELLIELFGERRDWSTELRERHRFPVDCLRLASRPGVEYGCPIQTVYVQQDGGEPVAETEAIAAACVAGRGVVEQRTGLDSRPPPVRFR